MPELSKFTLRSYECAWNYIKSFITDINNVDQTITELKSIKHTSQQKKPVTDLIFKNYVVALMHNIRDKPELRAKYGLICKELKAKIKKQVEEQKGTELIREKLKDLTWPDILKLKDQILADKKVTDENKLLVRLYTELDHPVRNDYAKLHVFIDEPRPTDFVGSCLMLTCKPIASKPRTKKVKIIKSDVIPEYPDAGFYPVRNIIWINNFKTSKTNPDIIQSIPKSLADDIIEYCCANNTNILFDATEAAISKRICYLFKKVSKRKIGINVMRHLHIMHKLKDIPMFTDRKKMASNMGHSVTMQEFYRVKIE
jgi:hypothetical protein